MIIPLFANAAEVSTIPGKTKESSFVLLRFFWMEVTPQKREDGTKRFLPPGNPVFPVATIVFSRDAAKDFSRKWSGMMAKQDEGITNLDKIPGLEEGEDAKF